MVPRVLNAVEGQTGSERMIDDLRSPLTTASLGAPSWAPCRLDLQSQSCDPRPRVHTARGRVTRVPLGVISLFEK
jgi:hypothetical protein